MKIVFRLDKPNLAGVAQEIAARIRASIIAAPSNRWNKTGELLRSVQSVSNFDGSAGVAIAADRLNRPELLELFADEILTNPLPDPRVRNAISMAVARALRFEVSE